MTTAALFLDRRTGDRSIGTKHATIAGLRLEQRLALGAFVEILTRIRRHDLLPCVPAAGAGQHRLPDDGAHGFEMTFEGKPASVVARVSFAEFVLSGSKVTVAVLLSKSTDVEVTPGTRSSAFLTTIGHVPQFIFSTARVAVCGGAARAVPAAIRAARDTKRRVKRRMTI